MNATARGNLLSWLWLDGSSRQNGDAPNLYARTPTHDDLQARYTWLYARGGQCDLAQLGAMEDDE